MKYIGSFFAWLFTIGIVLLLALGLVAIASVLIWIIRAVV